jgi:outer membrane receptor protein involved in Fe transport
VKSNYSKLAGLLTVLALILSFSGIAMSQTETGAIVGTVTDPSGAVVPKAKVTLKSIGTGAGRSTVTDDSGSYAFTNVLPAVYSVTVEASGFAKVERRVQVTVGSRVTQDVALTIGAAQQIIEITAEGGVGVNTETQTLGQVIDTRKITELPTLTRNPYALVGTSGNVSEADPSGRGAGYAINGLRAASTNILLDGAANNDEFTATPGQSVPLDSVQEFSVLTNSFTAEYGRAAGGVVNLATKSGTNEYHGTVYDFNRVSKLASNSFDNNANGITKPRFTRNQFGFSVGGPVLPSLKDKLFFFSSAEWTRVRSQGSRTVVVPDAQLIASANALTQAIFTANTLRPNLRVLGTHTLASVCASIGGCTGAAATLLAASPSLIAFDRVTYNRPADSGGGGPQNTLDWVARVDWNISQRTQAYARYALDRSDFFAGSNADSPYAGYDTGAQTRNHNGLLSVTHTWNQRLVSQSKVVISRLNQNQPLGAAPIAPTYYFRDSGTSPARVKGDLTALPGYLPFSPGSAIPFGGPQNFLQLYHDMSYARGKHQLRFGGSYVFITDNRAFGAYENSTAAFNTSAFGNTALNGFLAGTIRRFQVAVDPQGKFPCPVLSGGANSFNPADPAITAQCMINPPVTSPNFTRSNRYHEFAVYGQDSWKITPRVTINLGLRWEYFGVQHNKNPDLDSNYYDGGGASIFERIKNGNLAIAHLSSVGGLWKKDLNNFAPRLGFAWDVFGNGKTSLRGGYGIGYERNFGNVTFNVIQNPPGYAVVQIVQTIPVPTTNLGPLSGAGPQPLRPTSARNVDPNIVTAFAHTWSLAMEHEAMKNLIVAVDYSGSKGEKLYSLENPNRAGGGNVYLGTPCTAFFLGTCGDRLRNTQYGGINRRSNNSFSNYNAMNVRVELKNVANSGLNLRANYTWAHTFDNLSSTFSESNNNVNLGLLDPFNPKLDYGAADFDIRHRFGFSGIWDIPFAKNMKGPGHYILHGWTLAPIFTASSGTPFTVFDCTNAFYEVCPRVMTTGTGLVRKGPGNPPLDTTAGATPNTYQYIQLPAGSFDSTYANPFTFTSEFGPFPNNMTKRNFYRGPGNWNLDLGIYKTTKVTERFSVQLRGEMYNTFNHANLFVLLDQTDVSSTSYIPARRNGRRNVQLAVKLIF